MKRHCSSSLDRISELPCNITQTILMYLSLRDMVRTSILARSWRFKWTKVPQLIFDNCRIYSVDKVFGIFIQHQGPIFKFMLCIEGWQQGDIDKIIPYLARNGIQELEMYSDGGKFEVPSSIFSCVELKRLSFTWCVLKPITFDGFNKLIALELMFVELDSHVSISSCPLLESLTMAVLINVDRFSVDAPRLKTLSFLGSISNIGFMNTPLLKLLSFTQDDDSDKVFTIGLRELLCSLPHLENLVLSYTFLKLLAFGDSQYKFPTVLNRLRKLDLIYVNLNDTEEVLSTLGLIRNSPNLLKLKFEQPIATDAICVLGARIQDYSAHYLMMKLQEVEMVFYCHSVPCHMTAEIELLRYLLDVSPVLEKLYIGPSKHPDEGQSKVMLDLACYRRASPKAEIVFKHM